MNSDHLSDERFPLSGAEESVDPALLLCRRRIVVLCGSVLAVALCGIVYELLIATVSSYLLGNSVLQFSMTIGLFMAAMGIGSYASRHIRRHLLEVFIAAEIALALAGGGSSAFLFVVFPQSGLYTPVMVVLILIIGTLVGLEIPIIVRVLSQHGGLRRGVADALSFDYVGALIGSVAFPLFLLPHLGLFRSSFAIGILNSAVAIINVLVFRKILIRAHLLLGAAIGSAALLLAAVTFATQITSYSEDRLFADRVVFRRQTPYQRIVLTVDESNGEHRLYLDGHIQFAQFDEYRYHEALVHPLMSLPGPRSDILVLGGGDGLAVREVWRFDQVENLVLVDLDPQVVELCRTFPPIARLNGHSLDDPRLRIHNEDAFIFAQRFEQKSDRIIIDLPDPHNESLAKLYSVEFYRLLRGCLNPGGLLVTQSSSPYYTPEVFFSIRDSLEAAGFTVLSYQITVPSFGIWGFHLAGADGLPTDFDFPKDARFMSGEVMEAAMVFGSDQRRPPRRINSIFEPDIYRWYRIGVDRGRPAVEMDWKSRQSPPD